MKDNNNIKKLEGILNDPIKFKEFAEASKVYNEIDTDGDWEKVREKLTTFKKNKSTFNFKPIAALAASIALLVLIWTFFKQSDSNERISLLSYDTTSVYTLPDSSVVTLAHNSKLTLDENFSDKNRTLSLEGEAFFEVKRDPAHPFVIKASNLTIEVKGTSFNVENRTDQHKTSVNVASGKVQVFANNNTSNKYMLNAMQAAVLEKDLISLHTANVNAWSWKTRKMVFSSSSLNEVLHTIEKNYGVNFSIEPYIKTITITSTFDNQPLNEVINELETLTGMKFIFKNGSYVLQK